MDQIPRVFSNSFSFSSILLTPCLALLLDWLSFSNSPERVSSIAFWKDYFLRMSSLNLEMSTLKTLTVSSFLEWSLDCREATVFLRETTM